jgi:hypothetical protein
VLILVDVLNLAVKPTSKLTTRGDHAQYIGRHVIIHNYEEGVRDGASEVSFSGQRQAIKEHKARGIPFIPRWDRDT